MEVNQHRSARRKGREGNNPRYACEDTGEHKGASRRQLSLDVEGRQGREAAGEGERTLIREHGG